MKSILPLLVLMAVVGCKAPGHMTSGESSKLNIGMTKAELFKAIGKPDHIDSDGTNETVTYILERPWWQDVAFKIKMVDGKVSSYGAIQRGETVTK
jgi:hypothetical protein